MSRRPTDTPVGLALVGVAVVMGGNMVAVKAALHFAGPLTVQALSTVVATGWLVPWARARRITIRTDAAGLCAASLTAVPMAIVSSVSLTYGLAHMDAGRAAVLMSATPITSLVIERTLLRGPGTWRGAIGVGIGFVGVLVVALNSDGDSTGNAAAGTALVLIGAFGWSLGMVGMRLSRDALSPSVLVLWQMILALPVLLVAAWLKEDLHVVWTPALVVAVLYGGVLAKAVIFLIQLWAVGKASVLTASSTAFLMPISGMTAGAIAYHETVEPPMLIGSLVILTGVLFVAVDATRRRIPVLTDGPPVLPH